jgi:hypothetical protein
MLSGEGRLTEPTAGSLDVQGKMVQMPRLPRSILNR